MTAGKRFLGAEKVIGATIYGRLKSSKVLCVGAGGIGCELLKNLVMTGFGKVTVIDLDTIDLSNLNRQFLFQKQHVKKSKALVAKQTALEFNPHAEIEAIHGNIKDTTFNVKWFAQFDIVLNALDNLDARRHVNKMCLAANVPLIESGTAGYSGQVQPILKDQTECYDCNPKPVAKSYPVCTIRSTPSAPIHCIVWGKSYLLAQLFGPEDEVETEEELNKALENGENASEIAALKAETQEMSQIRRSIVSEDGESVAGRVFNKVFKSDIERLLKMEDMWKSRIPPKPLAFEDAQEEMNGPSSSTSAASHLKDQQVLSLTDNVKLYADSFQRLARRFKADPSSPISFDKDDEDTLDFVVATSNLRAHIFGIQQKSKWEVKGLFPSAIATTNAAVAGLLVMQAASMLRTIWSTPRTQFPPSSLSSPKKILNASHKLDRCHFVWFGQRPGRVLQNERLTAPNGTCTVCRSVYVPVNVSNEATLGNVVDLVKEKVKELEHGEFNVTIGTNLVYDPDFDDFLEKTLTELDVQEGGMITINDEEDVGCMPLVFIIQK
ncbi:hypothetical protein BT69DRAFT_1344085 [Atractiella rhizophila]|nr:hypothetical protein BT69DRAFT_1344085 [Atractiella rhizophila]